MEPLVTYFFNTLVMVETRVSEIKMIIFQDTIVLLFTTYTFNRTHYFKCNCIMK